MVKNYKYPYLTITAFLGIGAILFVILSFSLWFYSVFAPIGDTFWEQFDDWSLDQEPWVEVGFDLPNNIGHIVLLRQHAHPFLAEYNRKIRLEMPNQKPVTLELPVNVGGRILIRVYLYTERLADNKEISILRLTDHWGKYYVDLSHQILLETGHKKYGFGDVNDTGFGEVSHPVYVETVNIHEITQWEYLGRFDGQKGPLEFIANSVNTIEPNALY